MHSAGHRLLWKWVGIVGLVGLVACGGDEDGKATPPGGGDNAETGDAGMGAEDVGDDSGGSEGDTGGEDMDDAGADDVGEPMDAADDAGGDDTGEPMLVEGCAPDALEACVYTPAAQSMGAPTRVERTISYTDITGSAREVFIELRRPATQGPDNALVIWSHGGSGGKTDPTNVGTGWGSVFARAGYASIAIAHPGRDADESEALCEALELGDCAQVACDRDVDCLRGEEEGSCTGNVCRYTKFGNWDRPHDFRAVLDWVEAEAAAGGALDGWVDTSKIVYAGHSAGAGSTNMVAGATRSYRLGTPERLLIDPRPAAFISCSPQGPGDDGFSEVSYTRASCEGLADPSDASACLSRPHLTLTGVGDSDVGASRRMSFDLAPEGDRFLLYILEDSARHTTFNYETDACERHGEVPLERCETYQVWLRSAALAFLDATMRGDMRARAYLRSANMATLGAGAATWEQR